MSLPMDVKNQMLDILDQVEQMSAEEQAEFWEQCPPQHADVLRALQEERQMLNAISGVFQDVVTTEDGQPMQGIRFESDPTGDDHDPTGDWGFDFETGRYT